MIFIIIMAIAISFILGLWCYIDTREISCALGIGFLGMFLGLLGGLLICAVVNVSIANEQHLIEQKSYDLIEITDKNFIGSKYIKEKDNGDYIIYINEDNILKEATITKSRFHRIISGKPYAVKNTYDFKNKFFKFLFDFDGDIEAYECYIPMEPLTSS